MGCALLSAAGGRPRRGWLQASQFDELGERVTVLAVAVPGVALAVARAIAAVEFEVVDRAIGLRQTEAPSTLPIRADVFERVGIDGFLAAGLLDGANRQCAGECFGV